MNMFGNISCNVKCERKKYEHVTSLVTSQPLLLPQRVFTDFTIDFVEALPKSQGKSVIMVVMNRLTKYAHFIRLQHPYIAKMVTQSFLDKVYKLHGLPLVIVINRDPIFY